MHQLTDDLGLTRESVYHWLLGRTSLLAERERLIAPLVECAEQQGNWLGVTG